MGDLSAEPSMEDILSSIKRIIAEEGETATRAKRTVRPVARAAAESAEPPHEVLELREALREPMAEPPAAIAPAPTIVTPVADPRVEEPIISARAAEASRGALDALSRMMVKPEPASDGTLEGLVRDMLRPMLRDWLDAHLPEIVEAMVAREIERISERR